MERWQRRSQRVTTVLLLTSVVLIVPGLLGVGATLILGAVLAGVAGACWQVRDRLATLPTVLGYELGQYGVDSWAGPLLGTAIVVVMLGASPAELQALGGLAGLVGMVNYFVRPLYLFAIYHVRRFVRSTN